MFTGIVEEVGVVESLREIDGGWTLSVQAAAVLADAQWGHSLAGNGAGLPITAFPTDRSAGGLAGLGGGVGVAVAVSVSVGVPEGGVAGLLVGVAVAVLVDAVAGLAALGGDGGVGVGAVSGVADVAGGFVAGLGGGVHGGGPVVPPARGLPAPGGVGYPVPLPR